MNNPCAPLSDANTVVAAMMRHVAEHPGALAFRFLGRHQRETRDLTWRELAHNALRLAALLEERTLIGQPIAIICPDPRDFVTAIAGCFVAGAIAVPVPAVATRRSAERIRSIVEFSKPKAIVATAATLAQPWIATLVQSATVHAIAMDRPHADLASSWRLPEPSSPALMQFTSGATGAPSGVLLTHANIAANSAAIVNAYDLTLESRGLSWLPLHHDMGLVGHVLTTLWIGGRSTIMDPLLFLQSPLRWLRHMSEERSTITSAPNFAYELCCKAAQNADLRGIDLSSIATAVCGGEAVWPDTVERFCTTFAPYGMAKGAFTPSYGLAEATLLVSSGKRSEGPRIFSGAVRNSEPTGICEQQVHATSLGPPALGTTVRVVDNAGVACSERVIGEIEVSGRSVGQVIGTDNPTDQILTGDLGFLHNGEIHIVGRRKELIILRGQNVYPADIESAAVKAHPAIEPGGVAAVAISQNGTEALLLVFEVERSFREEEYAPLCRRVTEEVGRSTGHVPWRTIAVSAGALKRTTSGKIQRNQVAGMFVRGELKPLEPAHPRKPEEFRV